MLASIKEELHRRIQPGDQVLDIGGWHAPINRANAMIDIMPYETRHTENATFTDIWPTEQFTPETYHQRDICVGPWPFDDKQFDFSICSHTLEDLRDPLTVCREIVRVSKAGYIEVPSRIAESTRGLERPFYCGYYHHRWMCELEKTSLRPKLMFMFKPAMIHAYRRFHFKKPWYKKINPKYDTISFFWTDSFDFDEKILIDRDEVQSDLRNFKLTHLTPDLFIRKYSWLGQKL